MLNIKINVFNTIRSFDGLDDDKHRYNTSEGIRNQITNDILNSKELRENNFIKNNFDLINTIGEKSKIELYKAVNGGIEHLKSFFENKGLFEKLNIYNLDNKNDLLENIYDSLKKGKENIDYNKVKQEIKNEVKNKIGYLKNKLSNSNNKDKISDKINELQNSLINKNINKLVENIKVETIFKSFERIIIFQTLEKKSDFVEKLSKQNTEIELYRDIEGVGSKLSDENFNSISNGTQFLAEQIAIMFISGGFGNFALKGFQTVANTGKVTNLFKGGMNASNSGKIASNIAVEGTVFYGAYSALNGITNKENLAEIQDSMSIYDWSRTVVFLLVLRAFSRTSDAFTVKNITLDTRNILGTDLVIRGTIGELWGKEGLKGIDYNNLSDSDLKEFSLFIADELAFILPLVIGLSLSNKAFGKVLNDIKSGSNINTPKIEIIPTQKEFIIKIEGLQKEIRILKQNRDILRNKGKNTSEISAKLQDMKTQYKEERNINPELVEQNNISKQNNQPLQTTEPTINKKDDRKINSEEDVNMNTGNSPKYQRLAKYSEKVIENKLDYTLNDIVIGKTLTDFGIGNKGNNVGKGLLEKSGFKQGEKLEPKNKFEKDAIKEMKKANEVIYKEYKTGINGIVQGLSMKEAFPNLNEKLIPKLLLVITKENTSKRERF